MTYPSATRISPHLTWAELACHDARRTPYPIEWTVARGLVLAREFEAIRVAGGDQPLVVLSAYRTAEHNRAIGGARASQHVQGRALDLRPPPGMSAARFLALVLDVAAHPGSRIRGVGAYERFVHVDVRESARLARWTGTTETRRVDGWG